MSKEGGIVPEGGESAIVWRRGDSTMMITLTLENMFKVMSGKDLSMRIL